MGTDVARTGNRGTTRANSARVSLCPHRDVSRPSGMIPKSNFDHPIADLIQHAACLASLLEGLVRMALVMR